MTVKVQCPNPACGKSSHVPAEYLGRTARCPACREKFPLIASDDASPAPPDDRVKAATPAASLPEQVGRFLIRVRLGAGAFGAVYRAHDPNLDRDVALKVPHPGTLESPRAVERFLREAKAAARLHH